ncbi:MAG: hypothetical protein V8Q77_04145 [Bacilli bacterium]
MNNSSITEIKDEVKKANEELKETMNPLHSPLIEYYLSRYLEIHEYTLNNRLAKLDDEISKCQKEYEELMSREDHLEEIASKNKNIQERINVIDAKIKANNEFLEEKNQAFKEKADKVTNQENNLYNACLDYYQNILSKLSMGNIDDILEYINFVMDVLKYTIYDEVVNYKENALNALNDLDDLNLLEAQTKNTNVTLNQEKQSLNSEIESISFEETEQRLDAIAYEINDKKKQKKNLSSYLNN